MVVFNPQLGEPDVKRWGGDARPISDIPGNKSSALAISTLGEGLAGAVKITDQAIREGIKTDVYEGVDKLRDAYTESLKEVRNIQLASTDQTLLPDSAGTTNKAPLQLQNGLDRVKQIGTAMAQNGSKINDTLYTGALNSMAKQLRSQYPGYRDYIDEQIKSVSGRDPANAFMQNLMEDINRNVDANKTERNATKAMLRDLSKEGFRDSAGVHAADVARLFDAGRVDEMQVLKWVSSAKTLEWNNKQKSANRASRLEDDADASVNAGKDLSQTAAQTIAHNWQTMTIGSGTDTAEGMFKFIQANAGNPQVMDERSQAIGQQLTSLRNATFKQLFDDANRNSGPGKADSVVFKMGGDPDKAKKIIEGQLATFDLAIKAVFDKDWGAAYSHMNFNKAIAADTTNLLYNAPDEESRRYNRMVGAVNQISPQFAKDFFQAAIIGNIPNKDKEYIKTLKLELLTQPDGSLGKLTSINKSISDAKAKGVTSAKSYTDLIGMVDTVANPKVAEEQRVNVARGFFDPMHNAGLLSDKNFRKDYYDPERQRTIPGKYSVFTRLTSDKVAAGVADLSKSNPELAPMYRSTMTREFGEQLFNREIKDLSDYSNNGKWKIKFTEIPGRPPRFDVLDSQGLPVTGLQATELNAPIRVVNRLNIGLSGLYNVYSKTGGDPNQQIMQTLYKYGYQEPSSEGGRGKVFLEDVPGMFWNAITGSQKPNAPVEKDPKKPEGPRSQ